MAASEPHTCVCVCVRGGASERVKRTASGFENSFLLLSFSLIQLWISITEVILSNENKRDWLKCRYALERQKYWSMYGKHWIFKVWWLLFCHGGARQSITWSGNPVTVSLLTLLTELNNTAHCLLSTDSCCTVHTVNSIQTECISSKHLSDC